jgi:hypothetical protein
MLKHQKKLEIKILNLSPIFANELARVVAISYFFGVWRLGFGIFPCRRRAFGSAVANDDFQQLSP